MTQPATPQSPPSTPAPHAAAYAAPDARPGVGRLVWHDLMTTDAPRALAFYQALFDWTTRDIPMGEWSYTMLHVGELGIGGVVPLDPAHGVPSHWMGYVTVDDVDAACARVPELGGTVCVPPADIPNTGRFAVVEDPTGAVFSPFTFVEGQTPPEPDGPVPYGAFCWEEVMTRDPQRAAAFYAALLGWRYETMDLGAQGEYRVAHRGAAPESGMMQLPAAAVAEGARSHWLPYLHTADVDATHARAVEHGAASLVAPEDIPGIGRFAVLRDPTGARFALYRPVER